MFTEESLHSMTDAFDKLNISVFCKKANNQYIYCNERFAAIADFDSSEQIIGKRDTDFSWHKQADIFTAEDARVRKGKLLINDYKKQIRSHYIADVIETKTKLLDKSGQCIGIVGSFIDITGYRLEKNTGHYDSESGKFYLGKRFNNQYLTPREFIVFKNLILGNTAKEIAKKINCSYRTVEDYIVNIKFKLNCSKKNHLIYYAITYGLTHVINF